MRGAVTRPIFRQRSIAPAPGTRSPFPPDDYSFTGTVYAPDGIYIRGAGRDSTFLVKSDNTSVPMIIVDAKTGLPFKFSDITLQGRLDALQGGNRTTAVTTVADGGLYIKGAAKNFKIFNVRFTKFLRAGIEFQGDAGSSSNWGEQMGVIYRNEFIDNWSINLGYGVAVDGSVASWNRPIALGTANAVFVEDNLFVLNRHCVTSTNGANYVARYNTVKDNYQDAQVLRRAWPFPRLAPGNEKRRDLQKPREQFHHPLGRCRNPGRQRGHLGQYLERRVAWRGGLSRESAPGASPRRLSGPRSDRQSR